MRPVGGSWGGGEERGRVGEEEGGGREGGREGGVARGCSLGAAPVRDKGKGKMRAREVS